MENKYLSAITPKEKVRLILFAVPLILFIMVVMAMLASIEAFFRLNFFSNSLFFILGILAYSFYKNWKSGKDQSELVNAIKNNAIFVFIAAITTFIAPLSFGKTIEALGFVTVSLIAASVIMNIHLLKKMFLILGKYSYFIYRDIGCTAIVNSFAPYFLYSKYYGVLLIQKEFLRH